MHELRDRLIRRIVAQHPITYDKLQELTEGVGYTELQFMEAMELVHRDKRIVQSTSGETIVYRPYIARPEKEHFKSTVPYTAMVATTDAPP